MLAFISAEKLIALPPLFKGFNGLIRWQ